MHSLKGTSGTIGLHELHARVTALHDAFLDMEPRQWSTKQLKQFLVDLIAETNQASESDPDAQSTSAAVDDRMDKPLALILDDDVALLTYLKDELEGAGWSVVATASPYKVIEYFHAMPPDSLILDLHFSDSDGFQVIETLSEKLKRQYVPTMMISHDTSRQAKLKAYRMGIDDMLVKPIDMEEMLARLDRQLRNKRRLEQLLFIDELTGAYNRKYMHDLFNKLFTEMKRTGEVFSLAVLDLDHFKSVNDTYGHLIGDEVLRGFVSYLKTKLRSTDSIIRYGGEEFVIVMPRLEVGHAKQLLTEFIEGFSKVDFRSQDTVFHCSFSGGVTLVDDPGNSSHAWIEAADAALYQAKAAGRRRIVATTDSNSFEPVKRKLHIVIVDDDHMIRKLLSDELGEDFHDRLEPVLHAFSSGEQFFREMDLSDSAPYLVILDVMMPQMDGFSVLRRIRNLPNEEKFTVVMLTGRKSEQDTVQALQLGADDYVTKPFRIGELKARLKRLVNRVH
ncbi:diguanylate cyclase [Paenibacillus sp. J5C2022]|uniref:diguanylate cyclase n=1 Tax=Paenibacillus sp. J5C2022 TaxID=2977129 RepID=UPI0021CE4AAB|nr:diguanylate cyclase [Paenibacillus sp. J5C2022]